MRPCGCQRDPITFGHRHPGDPLPTALIGCPPDCRLQHAVPKAKTTTGDTP